MRPAGQANETDMLIAVNQSYGGWSMSPVARTLTATDNKDARSLSVFFHSAGAGVDQPVRAGQIAGTLQTTKVQAISGTEFGVRRFTPLECERLQGFPDDWTNVGISDSARYSALGDSVAVPCVQWIAERIMAVTP